MRLCAPCAALNCAPGACSKEGGCRKCRLGYYWNDMRNKTLPGYQTVSLPQNFRSCASCEESKCRVCDPKWGCKTW